MCNQVEANEIETQQDTPTKEPLSVLNFSTIDEAVEVYADVRRREQTDEGAGLDILFFGMTAAAVGLDFQEFVKAAHAKYPGLISAEGDPLGLETSE